MTLLMRGGEVVRSEAGRLLVLLAAASALALGVNALRPDTVPLSGRPPGPAARVRPLGPAELLQALARGNAVLVDSRDPGVYAAAHVTGALNLPAEPANEYYHRIFTWLSPAETVIVYGDSPATSEARDLAARLVANGFNPARVRVYEPGWQDLRRRDQVPKTGGGR
jgi:rhodanese-related sulfurtransferase